MYNIQHAVKNYPTQQKTTPFLTYRIAILKGKKEKDLQEILILEISGMDFEISIVNTLKKIRGHMVNIIIKPEFMKNYCGNHGKSKTREDHKYQKQITQYIDLTED